MLDNIEEIFSDIGLMRKKLDKPSYEANMEKFQSEQGHFIDEMIRYVRDSEDEKKAVERIAITFAEKIRDAFSVKGKISPVRQMDLNMFMVYFVFPAILLTQEECADSLCTGIKDAWNKTFDGSDISYTTYDKLYDAFREKIFGMSIPTIRS